MLNIKIWLSWIHPGLKIEGACWNFDFFLHPFPSHYIFQINASAGEIFKDNFESVLH